MKNEGILSERLRFLSIQISGMAYLIEGQSIDHSLSVDMDEIHFGLGLILNDISQKIRAISDELEKKEIEEVSE